jgi:hypothetical protein
VGAHIGVDLGLRFDRGKQAVRLRLIGQSLRATTPPAPLDEEVHIFLVQLQIQYELDIPAKIGGDVGG